MEDLVENMGWDLYLGNREVGFKSQAPMVAVTKLASLVLVPTHI